MWAAKFFGKSDILGGRAMAKVFVTGGTGFIGKAAVAELLGAGHEVMGLARTDESAKALEKAGATAMAGNLEDPPSLRPGALWAEVVIHLAFVHDFSDYGKVAAIDKLAIEAMGEALEGTGRVLVVTSGVPIADGGRVLTERDASDQVKPDGSPSGLQRLSESAALAFADRGVRLSVVRPPRLVHGEGDKNGITAWLVNVAREKGFSAYLDRGPCRTQAVHLLDAARLFRLAAERGEKGAVYQAVGEGQISFREIAQALAEGLKVPARAIPPEEAQAHFGFLAQIVGVDNPASSEITQKALGWRPEGPGLLEDLAPGGWYFRAG